ncbi:MAG: ribbon-helix-helix protein, CopG family [Acidobacteriota bacterium]
MIRTQIQLDEDRYRKVRELSRELGVSMAEVVRGAVDLAFAQRKRRRSWERARRMVGAFRSRKRDVAERHDDYLAEAFRK